LPVPGLPASGGRTRHSCTHDVTGRLHIEAVLLDMDGTLLDTERVYLESVTMALGKLGYTEGVVALGHAMVGIPGAECEIMLREHYGDDFPLADLTTAFVATRDAMFRAGIPLKPGAVELLDALQAAGYPLAIVTSSSRRTADEHLALAGIRARFETVLTRDDVARGKPSPDLYLLAASRFALEPRCCLAIEDSNPGVAAAYAAGAITIMVPDIVPPTEDSRGKCAAVLPDLNSVLELLQGRGAITHGGR
jgi:HAD superfamily hydrolase (TIGR01509 family)